MATVGEKMLKFLESIGIQDPSPYDLSFEYIKRDSVNRKKVYMTIRKETPWLMSLLSEFQIHLASIKYEAEIRFVYVKAPAFEDVERLFLDYYFHNRRERCPYYLLEEDDETINLVISDEKDRGDAESLAKDFNLLLKWIFYDYTLKVLLISKEKEPEISEQPLEEESSEEEASSSASSAPLDEDELEQLEEDRRKKEAEASYLATLAAEEEMMARRSFNGKIYRRGDYQYCESVAEVLKQDDNVEFSAMVFGRDKNSFRPGKRGGYNGVISVGDYTGAIKMRIVSSKSITVEYMDTLDNGQYVHVCGAMDRNSKTGEKLIYVHTIETVEKPIRRIDTSEEKRVELHLHTKMSAMDGLGEIGEYCRTAKAFGMKALAVTDHGVIQAYPAAESAGKKNGIKILYGIEFYMFDYPTYAYNPFDMPLSRGKYCVFDFETTGLSSRFDHVTEFGGVIVENGRIVDELDLFINPGVKIPEFIVKKTKITDEMVKDAPTEAEAVKTIMDFIGDAVLVSHNATFDVGFLNEMRRKAGMGPIENAYIDTLALSHYLFPERRSHRLGDLSKNLGLDDYNDDEAHRANFDANALNSVWQAIIAVLQKEKPGINLNDLNGLRSYNPSLFKHLRTNHVIALAKNQEGIKEIYRLVSLSHTKFLAGQSMPRITRKELASHRDCLIIGSACYNGEIFELAKTRDEPTLMKAMEFYDYIEIQPKENYSLLVDTEELSEERLDLILKSTLEAADKVGKMVCATGDCHYVNPEDKILRDVYISATALGGGFHPLFNYSRREFEERNNCHLPNPDQHFRSTDEMMESFRKWLPEEKCYEIVIKNTNLVADMVEDVHILKDHLFPPAANLPNSEQRLMEVINKNVLERYGENPPKEIWERLDKELDGIISNGYSVTYFIAHKIIEQANKDGYIVGSRGSVGSSFVATMSGVTEVNPLPPHYLCPKCKHFEWAEDKNLRSGFDLPEKHCPECGEIMIADGQSIPFETFLGFKAEKVPDIDLNFPPDYQARAHAYARTLLSTKEENEIIAKMEKEKEEKGSTTLSLDRPHIIRAGTIAKVEDKNAFGFVKGYYERVLGIEDAAPRKDGPRKGQPGNGRWEKEVNKNYASFLAYLCTGVKRTTGQHPGGIVVIPADMDIFDFTPYQHPADDPSADWLTTHYGFDTMHDSILKLDLLGHVNPLTLRMMSLLTGIDINTIPMNDKKILSLFDSPEALGMKENPLNFHTGVIGIPEFGTDFVQGLLAEAHPHSFDDLLIISGLSHGTNVWNGNAEDIVLSGKATLDGVIGCRDDIMNTLISYGLDNSESFQIMEKVRKGRGISSEWEEDMKDHKVPSYYIESLKKIKYLFPRAHATAYVMGAIRESFFKLYHPLEFYATYFSCRLDKYDIKVMTGPLDGILKRIKEIDEGIDNRTASEKEITIRKTLVMAVEMIERGFSIHSIDLMKSDGLNWVVDHENKAIIAPFSVISGLGSNAASSVVKAREGGPFISKEDLSDRTKLSKTDIANLEAVGALEGLGETNQMDLFSDFGLFG